MSVDTGVPVYAGDLHLSPLLSPRQVGAEKGYHAASVQESLRVLVHDPRWYCRDPGHPLHQTGGQHAGSARPLVPVGRRHRHIPVSGTVSGYMAGLTAGIAPPPLAALLDPDRRFQGGCLWRGRGSASVLAGLCGSRGGPGTGAQLLGHLPVLQLPDPIIHRVSVLGESEHRFAEQGNALRGLPLQACGLDLLLTLGGGGHSPIRVLHAGVVGSSYQGIVVGSSNARILHHMWCPVVNVSGFRQESLVQQGFQAALGIYCKHRQNHSHWY